MRGWCWLFVLGCSTTVAPRDAALEDVRSIDGGTSRLDVAACPSLLRVSASTPACDAFLREDLMCDAVIDAPSFEVVSGIDPCDGGESAPLAITAIEAVSCEGMTLRAGDAEVRVHFGGNARAADLLANGAPSTLSLAGFGTGELCTRRLRLEGEGQIELFDLPPGGGALSSFWAEALSIEARPVEGAACASLGYACLQAGDQAFGIEPCGGSTFPLGGCGDPIGSLFVGAASCGARLHVALFSTGYVPVCH